MRIAFYGSTSQIDGAELDLLRQYLTCSQALLPGEVITASFVDLRGYGTAPLPIPEGFGLERDGGLGDLMVEAARPGRRFDLVIVYSARHLVRGRRPFLKVMAHLTAAGVPVRAITFAEPPAARTALTPGAGG